MSNKVNDQLYDRLNDLGICELLTGKLGFGITDLEKLKEYADYFESLNHCPDSYFWALDALKTKIKIERYSRAISSLLKI